MILIGSGASGEIEITTFAAGCDFSTIVKVSVAPPSVTLVAPENSVTVIPAASLSEIVALTSLIVMPS